MNQIPPYFRAQSGKSPYHIIDSNMIEHWKVTKRGKGIKIGFCDTGIDISHPEFANRNVVGESFVPARRRRNRGMWNVDWNDHGTHVAGIAAGNSVGMCPESDIVMAQVLDGSGAGPNEAIADGIDYCREQGVNAMNLSVGGPQDSIRIADAIDRAHAADILVFIATGNEGASHVSFPAVHGIGIGAVDRNFKLADFSNRGKNVDLVGYGKNVYSSVPGGGYEAWNGTSMACPFVTGVFGNRQSMELEMTGAIVTRSPKDALKLETMVIDLGPEGKDTSTGRGFPDLKKGFTPLVTVDDGVGPIPGIPEDTGGLGLRLSFGGKTYGPVILFPNEEN